MKTFSVVPPLLITSFSCRNVLPTFPTSLLEAVTAHKTWRENDVTLCTNTMTAI